MDLEIRTMLREGDIAGVRRQLDRLTVPQIQEITIDTRLPYTVKEDSNGITHYRSRLNEHFLKNHCERKGHPRRECSHLITIRSTLMPQAGIAIYDKIQTHQGELKDLGWDNHFVKILCSPRGLRINDSDPMIRRIDRNLVRHHIRKDAIEFLYKAGAFTMIEFLVIETKIPTNRASRRELSRFRGIWTQFLEKD